jgi:hypothetical protein
MMPKPALFGCTAVASALFFVAFSGAAQAVTLAEAQSAYRSNRVTEAERMLTELAGDPAASELDRADARRMLARIDWMARAETDAALRALDETSAGEGACAVMGGALSVFREAENSAAIIERADAAGEQCRPRDAQALHVERALAHMALAAAASSEERARHLALADAQLDATDSVAAITPEIAGPRFSLALAQRDAAAAFAAWRTYYWLTDADAPQALSNYAGHVEQIFASGLETNASDESIIALIGMLARAGFTDDARQLSEQSGIAARASANAEWRRISAHLDLIDALRATTLRANREIINGGRATWYGETILADANRAMAAVGRSGDPTIVLPEVFGVFGTVGETGGYPSMHAGHLAEDVRMHVAQYGRSGEVRFIVIDNMIANGYESWLWDGWAEAGGWASDDGAIVQIRSAYTSGPVRALRRTRPGPERDAFQAEIARQEVAERAVLGRDGVAQLTATSGRLQTQAYDRMAAQIGADDDAFIAEAWRANNQYSITSHEGRHALDKIELPNLSSPQLEYRAKLSQIIFADYPRLGLASVAGGVINDTPHGYGNRRVLEGYRRWMRAHRNEIAGFDRNQPTLSQLDRLTDAQIVEAARSMDPWAR